MIGVNDVEPRRRRANEFLERRARTQLAHHRTAKGVKIARHPRKGGESGERDDAARYAQIAVPRHGRARAAAPYLRIHTTSVHVSDGLEEASGRASEASFYIDAQDSKGQDPAIDPLLVVCGLTNSERAPSHPR